MDSGEDKLWNMPNARISQSVTSLSLQKGLLVLFRNDDSTSVLIITGTHGKDGVTGLTDRSMLDRTFYKGDCKSKNFTFLVDLISFKIVGVGVVPRAESDEIPDIMEIQRAELSDDQDCFYNEPGINQMRIQVVRLTHDKCSPIKI